MLKNIFSLFIKQFDRIKKRFFQGQLTTGLFIIGSGVFIAQFIAVITTPIITRLYSPADFGILAVFSSSLAIIVIAGGFRYDSALPLPKEDIDAAHLFVLFFIILSVSTFILILILYLMGNLVFSFFHAENMLPYIFLFIIGFFGAGIYRGLTYWVTRKRDYARITYTKINQSIGGAGGKILLGLLCFGHLGLIIGFILSQCMGIFTLLKKMWEKDRHHFVNLSWHRMVAVAKEYRQFPLYSFPAAVFNTITTSAPAILLSSIYGFEVAGYYGLAYSMITLPGLLVSQSLSQVYYAEASFMLRENSKDLLELFKNTTKKLLLIGIPLIGVISIIAPLIFPIIFGEVWREAGYYCVPLSLAAIGGFVMSSTTNLGGYGFNNWQLVFDISRMMLVLGGFYLVLIFGFPVIIALLLYSSLMIMMYYVIYLMNIAAIKRIGQKF